MAISGTPSVGQVPTATSATAATWQDQAASANYHFEAIFDDTPEPILTNDGTDWVYGKVYDA